jgi:hypothetical protein
MSCYLTTQVITLTHHVIPAYISVNFRKGSRT